ncbi:1,2-phenylacetyl-CoA epoxidase subunit PaaC [Haladaptatus halobius]|uniref:1,2-phenylacetyl-CoA epoxidase subunit PaaC n=1 Tax=Haladaptatus halobius TaxID=2884875 RepID=UPI001D0B2A38|nr:1,2-phenylacetyl-CoA epoxidase subunit PaaC [Haladaptatus halobius]
MSAQLTGPDDLSDEERDAVESLLYRLADDEFVLAERYTEWQVRAPTLESDLAISNIAQDELGHARLWYDLLQDFGHTESELIFEREPSDFRNATLVELPFESGDWADAIVRGYFYDVAEQLSLQALEETSYPRIGNRVAKILSEEDYHREHAQNWLERLASDDEGRERVQSAVDKLFPYALTLFVGGEADEQIDQLGIRTQSLEAMREQWLDIVVPFLVSLDIDVPEELQSGDPDELLPEHVGRDGSHTDDWFDLHEDMTRSYRELGRSEAHRIMPDPDDE